MPEPDVRQPADESERLASTAAVELPSRYVVEDEIGRGGMGTVLRARDLKYDRTVAIKLLRPEIASTFGHERFLNEIRTVANLVHPHIVSVFDSGEAGQGLFFVMPYIEGESLRQRLEREGALPLGDALRIAAEVAGALQHAHRCGVVHRDVKPENILLSAEGHSWLVDFGVAQAVAGAGAGRLTATGLILGSPFYASPEQIEDARGIDARTDVYSLGCVLFEMLTGEPPFTGSSGRAVLLRHLTDPPPPLLERAPHLPAALASITERALAKEPAARFASAAELESAIAAVAPQATSASPVRAPRRVAVRAAALALTALALGMTVRQLADDGSPLPAAPSETASTPLDASRFLILPATFLGDTQLDQPEARLADALARWRDLDIIEASSLPVGAAAASSPTMLDSLSRAWNAGRFVRTTISAQDGQPRLLVEVGAGSRAHITEKFRISLDPRWDPLESTCRHASLSIL